MPTFSVTARGLSSVEVEGRNWIMALGAGLAELGRVADLTRLACEVLPNGTVIARDIASGTGYVVQGLGDDEVSDEPVAEALPDELGEEPSEEAFGEPEPSEELAELPADAITELPAADAQLLAIDGAESQLMACQLALQAALKRVPAESGAVLLEEKGHMRFTAVSGPHSRKLMGVRLPLGTGVAGFAMEKGQTIVLADAHDDPRHCGEVDALTGYTTRAIAVVPVTHEGQVIGVLELMNLPAGERFTGERVDAMSELAGALAARLGR
jgi:putative methionine-R-sulfoxide reductase with GAF domain